MNSTATVNPASSQVALAFNENIQAGPAPGGLAGQLQSRKPENPKIRADVRPGVRPGVRPDVRPGVRPDVQTVVGGARVVSGAEKKII